MKTSKTSAFTLIELLVVISIIAILASIAIPTFAHAQLQANQNKALQQCKGIFYGLKMFASDHGGSFPSKKDEDYQTGAADATAPLTDANHAYANLVPGYVERENPFSVPTSRYCKSATKGVKVPDNDFGSGRDKVLEAGENAFAYVMGLTDTSNSNYPIIADGFAQPGGEVQSPTYSATENDYGAVWKGKQAIVVRCDGSASLEKITQGNFQVKRPGASGGNMFSENSNPADPWLVGCKVLNPLAYP